MKTKNLVRRIFAILAMGMASNFTHAAIITKHNFTYDTVLNVVEGNGLLWKRWDETAGLSIDNALDLYSAEGWRLATSNEMVSLYNTFIPAFDWNVALAEDSYRGEFISVDDYHDLVSIFGVSIDAYGGISSVLFGEDTDQDGFYRSVFAQYSEYDPVAGISADSFRWTSDYAYYDFSVQLVKSTDVSAPPTLLIMLVLITLLISRQKRRY